MSNTWPEVIDRFNGLTESTKTENTLKLIFGRLTLCHANRAILAANTELDFRQETMSGHYTLDQLEDNSTVQVMLSLADMAEMESSNPTVGNVSSFYVDTKYVHYIPWGFNVIRQHIGVIAKSVYANPSELIPIQDILKFEALMKRFTPITVNFRLHMNQTTNLNHQFLIASGQAKSATKDAAIRKEIEKGVSNECEIFKQLIELGNMRLSISNSATNLDTAISEISRINRTFRW